MKKAIYERPSTLRFSVALEGNFAGSADVENPKEDNGLIEEHEINTEFTDDFSDTGWELKNQTNEK